MVSEQSYVRESYTHAYIMLWFKCCKYFITYQCNLLLKVERGMVISYSTWYVVCHEATLHPAKLNPYPSLDAVFSSISLSFLYFCCPSSTVFILKLINLWFKYERQRSDSKLSYRFSCDNYFMTKMWSMSGHLWKPVMKRPRIMSASSLTISHWNLTVDVVKLVKCICNSPRPGQLRLVVCLISLHVTWLNHVIFK